MSRCWICRYMGRGRRRWSSRSPSRRAARASGQSLSAVRLASDELPRHEGQVVRRIGWSGPQDEPKAMVPFRYLSAMCGREPRRARPSARSPAGLLDAPREGRESGAVDGQVAGILDGGRLVGHSRGSELAPRPAEVSTHSRSQRQRAQGHGRDDPSRLIAPAPASTAKRTDSRRIANSRLESLVRRRSRISGFFFANGQDADVEAASAADAAVLPQRLRLLGRSISTWCVPAGR